MQLFLHVSLCFAAILPTFGDISLKSVVFVLYLLFSFHLGTAVKCCTILEFSCRKKLCEF